MKPVGHIGKHGIVELAVPSRRGSAMKPHGIVVVMYLNDGVRVKIGGKMGVLAHC